MWKEKQVTGSGSYVKTESMLNQDENEENSCELRQKKKETDDQRENIQEIVESDFLT